jgi:hypothetical protein
MRRSTGDRGADAVVPAGRRWYGRGADRRRRSAEEGEVDVPLTHPPTPLPSLEPVSAADARRQLREQIARLERELSDAQAERSRHDISPLVRTRTRSHGARLLSLGQLEEIRDALVDARSEIGDASAEIEARRLLLDAMRENPRAFKGRKLTSRDLGEPGCHVYKVAPVLGVVGRFTGWWRVKVSSGCPLARRRPGRRCPPGRGGPPRRALSADGSRRSGPSSGCAWPRRRP